VCVAGPQRCPELCGDGVRGTCTLCGDGPQGPVGGPQGPPPPPPPQGAGGGQCSDQTEACDGADLGGASCVGQGYASGAIGCSSACELDVAACEQCQPSSARLLSCSKSPFPGGNVRDVALAATDDAVAVAWADDVGVRFALLGADLSLVVSIAVTAPGAGMPQRVAVTATETGWLVALADGAGLAVHAVNPSGTGAALVLSIPGGAVPFFAARPSGGPLLAWTEGQTLHAAVLSPDGTSSTAPLSLFSQVEAGFGAATWTGEAFLVADRSDQGVTVARIEQDGTAAGQTFPVSSSTEYPQIAAAGSSIHLVYSNFSGPNGADGVYHARLDAAGKVVGAPSALALLPQQFNVAPLAPFGDDVLVLLGGYTGGTGTGNKLDAIRVSPGGAPVGEQVAVARLPDVARWRVAARGSEAVAAWLDPRCGGSIGLARVAP
jgi:hypothetical protein